MDDTQLQGDSKDEQIQQKDAQIEELNKLLVERTKQLEDLKRQYDEIKQREQTQIAELSDLKQGIEESQTISPDHLRRLQEAEEKLGSLKTRRETEQTLLERQLADAKQQQEETTRKILETRLAGLIDSVRAEEAVAELNKENRELKTKLKELEIKLSAYAEDQASPKSPIRSLSPSGSQGRLGVGPQMKPGAGMFTIRRGEQREEEIKALSTDLSLWMNKLMGTSYTHEDLVARLSTGVDLCSLLTRIDPSLTAGKIHPASRATPGSAYAGENLNSFVRVCQEKLQVKDAFLFTPDQVLADPRKVVLCLLDVARQAHTKFNIEAPDLVKLEKDIAKEEAARAKKAAAVEAGAAPTDAKEDEAEGKEGLDLQRQVEEFCKRHHLKAPTRVKGSGLGQYKFEGSDVALPVRVLHSTFLMVKDGDKWKDLKSFINQQAKRGAPNRAGSNPNLKKRVSPISAPPSSLGSISEGSPSSSPSGEGAEGEGRHVVNSPSADDDRLARASARIKELEVANATLSTEKDQLKKNYEDELSRLQALLKAATEEKHDLSPILPEEQPGSEEPEEEDPPAHKERSCWSWFSKDESAGKDTDRTYPKKKNPTTTKKTEGKST